MSANLYEKLKRFNRSTTAAAVHEPPMIQPETPKPSGLPEELLHIPGVVKASNLNGIRKKRDAEKERLLQTVGFDIRENEQGSYACRDTRYPAKELPYRAQHITSRELVIQCRDERFASINAEDMLFIDTETTGLAGGTGTVPFLIGAGFFDETDFIVRQFFMRDYPDEPAVLYDLEELLAGYRAVSSFNGKRFDVPLLQSRYLLNRLSTRIGELPHADLLYPARRFWRNVLPDCRLGTIEEQILGHKRTGDIPGELIPYVFFDFVRGQRLARMKPVLHHNNEDIVTLAMMAARVCRMLHDPKRECISAHECAGAARCFDGLGMTEDALDCLHHAIELDESGSHSSRETAYRIRKQLTVLLKRERRIADAAAHWQIMAEWNMEVFPLIELAKYFEHTRKDYEQAMQYTHTALAMLELNRFIVQNSISIESMRHRLERLRRKLNLSK